MKPETRSNSSESHAGEPGGNWVPAEAADRALSRDELCRLLAVDPPVTAVTAVKTRPVPVYWLDKLANWISARLWKKTVIGYQDEEGFHYGTPPAGKESHAISD